MLENSAQPARPATRILALDGLRGLAILFVFINHLRLQPFIDATPDWLSPLWAFLSANGKAGVCLFFILSGYWAVTLYRHIENPWHFWQKRYARIFPALIVMCLALSVIRLYWSQLPPLLAPAIVIAVAYGFTQLRTAWFRSQSGFKAWLFPAFMGLQVLVALYYLFVLPQTPPAVFYQVWPGWIRQVVVLLVNSTMTLPLGRYIGQLDGVYWALTVELAFYLLYPQLILPFFQRLVQARSLALKLLAGGLVFPFVAGLYFILQRFLGFSIMSFYFFIFILAGMVLGELNLQAQSLLRKVLPPRSLRAGWVIGAGIALLFGRVLLYRYLPDGTHLYLDMAWTIPTVIAVTWALHSPAFSQWLSQPWLVKLGGYSYVIYLTHTIAIEMFMKGGEPQTVLGAFLKVLGAIVVTTLLTVVIYRWVEQKPAHLPTTATAHPQPWWATMIKRVGKILERVSTPLAQPHLAWGWIALAFFIVGAAWYGYRAPVSLFLPLQPHLISSLPAQTLITQQPTFVSFTATHPNLGMMLLHLKQTKDLTYFNEQAVAQPTQLQVAVLDANQETLSTSVYQVMELGDSQFHPIGIPVQLHSQDQTYTLRLQALNPQPEQVTALINDGVTLRSVYFPTKAELLRQPALLGKTIWSQLSDPFTSSTVMRWSVLATLPFMLLLGLVVLRGNNWARHT